LAYGSASLYIPDVADKWIVVQGSFLFAVVDEQQRHTAPIAFQSK
jgi:hypothetical protein